MNSYSEWLALTPQQQLDLLCSWDAYGRENVKFALMAAGRFAFRCEVEVLDVVVGTYHGGEYVLNVTVDAHHMDALPGFLQSSFEGFRIIYIPHPNPND